MIKRLQPIKMTEEVAKSLEQQASTQTTSRAMPKSTDPVNFPVFEVPVNKKVLIYVPNHVKTNEDGTEELLMDKPLIHVVEDGSRFLYYRCTNNIINEELGFDGSCPLCDGTSDPWDLANEIIKEKCRQSGLDPEDKDNQSVRAIRSSAFSDRVIKESRRYYTFPIVVFETVNDDGKTFVKDDNGNIKFKTMWYTISESAYEQKWTKTLESMEDEPSHPGGHFFLLNYCYTPKNGQPNKRDSARELAVIARHMKNSEGIRKKLDELTADWTPAKAAETVVNNQWYTVQDLQYVADAALEKTRNLLALYQSKSSDTAIEGSAEPEFKLEKKEEETPATAMDETDADIDEDLDEIE